MVIGVIGTFLGVVGGILLAQNIGSVVPFLEGIFWLQPVPVGHLLHHGTSV